MGIKFSKIFFFILIYLSSVLCEENQKIKICIKQQDMTDSVSFEYWENYKNELKNYFAEKVKDNEKLNNYELDIYFYPYLVETDGQSKIFDYINNLVDGLSNKEYDMIILDERILFNDIALMESEWIYKNINYRQPSLELLHDLSEYINKKDLNFHDPKVLSYGMNENKIYGIPFEYDFDVLYYHKDGEISNENSDTLTLIENMEDYTWESLLKQMDKNGQSLRVSLSDDNDLLNFIIEYTSNNYKLSVKNNPNYMKLFYNESSSTYYTKLRDLVKSFSQNKDVKSAIESTLNDAYNSFLAKNSTFFKAKASHNFLFKSKYGNDGIPLSLPPKYQSATTNKYLVANKYSDIKPDLLAEVALILTDKEAQLFRAEKYGSIPTFDFTKKDSDQYLQDYCNNNPVICDAMDKMEKLYIRDIFSSDTMVPFYEILCFIPIRFKNYFLSNDLEYIKSSLQNVNEFVTSNLGIYGTLSKISVLFVIGFCCYVIFMTYILKEHPYIKVMSPPYCNLIVIGCILNMIKLMKFNPPYTLKKIKTYLFIETLSTSLIFIPMFVIIYRIYYIYKTKSLPKKSTYKTLFLICVIAAIFVGVIYNVAIIFNNKFYYETVGSVSDTRIPIGYFSNYETLNKIYNGYLTIIFITIFIMAIYTGTLSKRFLDISYIFVIYTTNIADYIVERLITRLKGSMYYPMFILLIVLFHCIVHFNCVYLLIGLRIYFIKKNPRYNFDNIYNTNVAQLIPLKYKTKTMSVFRRFSVLSSTSSFNNNPSIRSGGASGYNTNYKAGSQAAASFKTSNSNIRNIGVTSFKSSNTNIRSIPHQDF
ncbi:hypothetical protein BCR36DRAFT_412521 [Piromyces finnis]|uniref:G-protein coupled receptors family 3 profile domain-containing protein n=1 Tax=Piromyces finnis TaxID=1754191 RepID=A0A1Y1V9I2_9FUNG|nr:hypothetical protein BCR36DRAFT_412521 [Piromyces finnis]|eukprot:ORX50029.1 hypothetical protein BCR36DRAFT_412521 [Piromyces finnis]